MNNTRNIVSVALFSAIFMLGIPLSSYAGQMTGSNAGDDIALVAQPAEATAHDRETVEETANNGKGAAKGCATGAAVGTLLFPGIGTAAGCALLAIVGWLW